MKYELPVIENSYLDDQYYINITPAGGHILGTNSRSILLGVYIYLYQLGFSCFFIQYKTPYTFMSRWYEHVNDPYLNKEEFHENIAAKYRHIIDQALQKRSLLHHRVGHGWTF